MGSRSRRSRGARLVRTRKSKRDRKITKEFFRLIRRDIDYIINDHFIENNEFRISRNIFPVKQVFYKEVIIATSQITTAGVNILDIRPKEGQLWLLDRVHISHTEAAGVSRIFRLLYRTEIKTLDLVGSTHMEVVGGGVVQSVFPIWHDLKGVEQDHIVSFHPLQLDHNLWLRVSGADFLAGKNLKIVYGYRRVI